MPVFAHRVPIHRVRSALLDFFLVVVVVVSVFFSLFVLFRGGTHRSGGQLFLNIIPGKLALGFVFVFVLVYF